MYVVYSFVIQFSIICEFNVFKTTKMSVIKRKRIVVTMEQKLNAIERLDKGESVKLISDKLSPFNTLHV